MLHVNFKFVNLLSSVDFIGVEKLYNSLSTGFIDSIVLFIKGIFKRRKKKIVEKEMEEKEEDGKEEE